MNYSIVKYEVLLKNFIKDFLPDLKEHETFYVCLMVRSKYVEGLTHIKTDRQQLKRFISNKENLYSNIKKLEVELGLYTHSNNPVPIEALALYILPNPRDMKRATKGLAKKLVDIISDGNYTNLQQLTLTEIHKAKSRSYFIDVDIDVKDEKYTKEEYYEKYLKDIINYNAFHFLVTRGGYHLLIRPDLVEEKYVKTFYKDIMSHRPDVDIIGDNMIPIPGTVQGNFVPFYEL